MRPLEEDPRYAELAARALATDDAAAPQTSLGDRAAAVAAIERALRSRSRRRSPWLGVGLAAAAIVLVAVGWTAWLGPRLAAMAPATAPAPTALPVPPARTIVATIGGGEGFIEQSGTNRPTSLGVEVTAGARVSSPARSSLTLAISTGTRLRLGGASSARVAELGAIQRFALESGEIDADVAKLTAGQRFLIDTPDAEIEVKGTRFEVVTGAEPSRCGLPVRTRVFVREGVVAVRNDSGEVRVAAGSSWPPACDEQPPRHAAHKRQHGPKAAAVSEPSVADAHVPAETASTLAEQNDLFAAALTARSRGDTEGALRWLDELLARYPKGQLVDSARAERRRLLSKAAQSERPE